MALKRLWAIDQLAFGGVTYDEDTGGPLDWDVDDSVNSVADRTAGARHPQIVLSPEADMSATVTMREPFAFQGVKGVTNGSLEFTFLYDDGTTGYVVTLASMMYLGERSGGQKSVPAQATLAFQYFGTGTGRITKA